jgi:DNA-binding NtrC family response regulator
MIGIYRLAERASAVSANVLIIGENGVGKEYLARQIHRLRDPEEKNFHVYRCHDREVDFQQIRKLFEDSVQQDVVDSPVTVFLKFLEEVDLKYQLQLLELLEEDQFAQHLEKETFNSRPRLICSCVVDNSMKTEGMLQQRLAYRLDVIHIEIPPLRERKEEILPLADLFLQEFKVKYGKPARGFSQDVRTRFLKHSWPGNVRELKNIVEQGVMLSKGEMIDNICWNEYGIELRSSSQ